MRFVLTDYQERAAADVVRRLRQSTREFEEANDYSAVSLSAPTGAGKTVIATAVMEALFFGDDLHGPDPDATVLWITDQPSLNEQTLRKMSMASTELKPAQLVTVDAGFDQELFESRRVYFLNIQKLGRATSYVHSGTDTRRWSLWDTIGNTIRARGGHFYVIIDEAHRGTGRGQSDRGTIISRIISDPDGALPSTPVVWGISATPERFQAAMRSAASPSRTIRDVSVPAVDVRASGLLKDVLDIQHPAEAQSGVSTLTALAARQLKTVTERWAAYATIQQEPLVTPALVVQVPASVSDGVLGEVLSTLQEEWPALSGSAVAHALESHASMEFSGQVVRYVAPEDIQDDQDLRVVFFKEALTTGWDCPRAEVMLSLRKADDYTYIAQLIGRMVRTPLARRIASDDTLNSVSLYLPKFDRAAVDDVLKRFEEDDTAPPIKAIPNAVECPWNPALPIDVKTLIQSLPTYVVPGAVYRSQVARLRALAARLARDHILENAKKQANTHLIGTIERERAALTDSGEIQTQIRELGRLDVGHVKYSLQTGDREEVINFAEVDSRDIQRLFTAARRGFRDGLAVDYWSHLLDQQPDPEADNYIDPDEAKIITAALATDPTVVEAVEEAAAELTQRWLKKHSTAIANLPDAAKVAYQQIRTAARQAELTDLVLPMSILAPGDAGVPRWEGHVYTRDGGFPATIKSTWETETLAIETGRDGFVTWYRNPTGGDRAIRIPYEDSSGAIKAMYPDFLFIHKNPDGGYRASIIDPHSHALGDAGPKLRGLSAYAEVNGDSYHRIDAIIKTTEGTLMRLDLKDDQARVALTTVNDAQSIQDVFTRLGGTYA